MSHRVSAAPDPVALVADCPLVITPALLRLPDCLYHFPRLPAAQLRYTLRRAADSLPAALILPCQPVILAPVPRWIPAQTIPLCSYLWHRPNIGPLRRWWFRCPGRSCRRRCLHLYLPDRAQHWRCSHCHHLSYDRTSTRHLARTLRRRGLPPGRAALSDLAAIATCLSAPSLAPPPLSVWPALWRWSLIGEGGGKWARRPTAAPAASIADYSSHSNNTA